MTGREIEDVSPRLAEVIARRDLWPTCVHQDATPADHRCPECSATLRRCCLSAVGRPHVTKCREWRRRQALLRRPKVKEDE